jgi:hypothetical protein
MGSKPIDPGLTLSSPAPGNPACYPRFPWSLGSFPNRVPPSFDIEDQTEDLTDFRERRHSDIPSD